MPNLTEPDELAYGRKTGREPTVLDVRSPEEVAAGHISGAVNIPVGEVEGRAPNFCSCAGSRLEPSMGAIPPGWR